MKTNSITQRFCLLLLLILFSHSLCAKELNLNATCQAMLTNPETGLVATTDGSYDYTYAERNANVIINVLKRLSKNQDLLLPEGVYWVNTILIAKTVSNCTIAGAGMDNTVLKRAGFSWDNNTQGDCPLRTEVFLTDNVNGLNIEDMTIDGNCHHLAISGYGTWNTSNGNYTSGLPQFPTYTSNDAFSSSGGSVINIRLSKNIQFENVAFKNGYGWCVLLGKVNGFVMRNCILDTGNLSTEFKGHFNPAPNNTVMHMHTSQDGLHLVNVSNALIEYNDIHSEDSAIAIEFNPAWDWGGYDVVENVTVKNNYISTASPTDPDKLMNDDDIIYGTGLANVWTGQSAVDIFYNEQFDANGSIRCSGENYFQNIEIRENAFENVRQGVRCGFFIGASLGHYNHRIYNLIIKDHEPSFLAGRDRNKPAGIRNVTKNTYSGSWNKSGGAGIAVRYTDSLIVSNNRIEEVKGGLGISIENVTRFTLTNNWINNISGRQLGDLGSSWVGGEGIRVYNNSLLSNDPLLENGCFNAQSFLIKNNYIGNVETTKMAIIATKNGVARLDKNYALDGTWLCQIDNGINNTNTQSIEWGDCTGYDGLLFPEENMTYRVYPNPVEKDLWIVSQQVGKDATFELFSLTGEKLYSGQLISEINVFQMESIPSGIYLLVIKKQDGLMYQNKIIKK